jgi:hypothetical protein
MNFSHLRAQLASLKASIPSAQTHAVGRSHLALLLRESLAAGVLPPPGMYVRQPGDPESRLVTDLRASIEAEKARAVQP